MAKKPTKTKPTGETAALAQRFGTNRANAHRVGEALDGCTHVVIPFAGGMCEVRFIKARTIVVNDADRLMIRLAKVTAHREYGPKLYRCLRRLAFDEETLAKARIACGDPVFRDTGEGRELFSLREFRELSGMVNMPWFVVQAAAYFVCVWMVRAGTAGTKKEMNGGLSIRWSAGGGDSVVRYRSAVSSLPAWRAALARATITARDAFDVLDEVNDDAECGVYVDPPWPDVGDDYKHPFTEADHEQLAAKLATFKQARVVLRYNDHPLIRRLYPADRWKWETYDAVNQAGVIKSEVLIVDARHAAAVDVGSDEAAA